MTPAEAVAWLRRSAAEHGFSAVGVARPDAITAAGARLATALADGHHGTMDWLATTAARRGDPRVLWPDARAVVMLAFDYGPAPGAFDVLSRPERGAISVYARHRDYHDVLKGRLKLIAGGLVARAGGEVKVFVDTAPVMEKPLAAAAGLGWQGKHTNLVSRRSGSWLFLASLFTTLPLPADATESDHCGSCRACLDACPTDAFPAPYRLDARRCVSYLTIEHAGPIPRELRPGIGNRIYGCDDCLMVCPWNKFAAEGREAKLAARADLDAPPLAFLAGLDDAGFRTLFSGSPIKRIGRDRFVRNVLVAIGNSGDAGLAGAAEARLDDAAAVVRGAAAWALSRLGPAERFMGVAARRLTVEDDAEVRAEWHAALAQQEEARGRGG